MNLFIYYSALKKLIQKRNHLSLFFVISLIPFWGFLFYFFNKHIGEFGCFDDCNNFMGGYFLLHGKKIFTEFFFNHQPLMAYISWVIQLILQPKTLYILIFYHRVFVFLFSVLFGSFLIFRFGKVAVGFVLLYEVNKYYVFGNRFLAESFVIYVIVFLCGILWYKLEKKKIYLSDYILSGVISWFVIFIREPYIPLTLFLFACLLYGKKQVKEKIIATAIFIILTTITLLSVSVPDMILNVLILNQRLISGEIQEKGTTGLGVLKLIFYPLQIFITGKLTIFREVQIILSSVFLFLTGYYLYFKKYISIVFVWITLLLASLRYIEPGSMYYDSYHILVWYGVYIFFIMLLITKVQSIKIKKILVSICIFLFLFSLLSPQAFYWKTVDKEKQFTEGYGHYYITGTVIKTLSNNNATLFVEGMDDMIYWQADIKPAYKYQMFTGIMPVFTIYTNARDEMFAHYPPDFYVGNCDTYHKHSPALSAKNGSLYNQLLFNAELTCIYVKKSYESSISPDQWKKVNELGYHL